MQLGWSFNHFQNCSRPRAVPASTLTLTRSSAFSGSPARPPSVQAEYGWASLRSQQKKASRKRPVFTRACRRVSAAQSQNRGEKQRVPDAAIFATKKRLTLPSLEEGFDELYSVRCRAHNDFVVSS